MGAGRKAGPFFFGRHASPNEKTLPMGFGSVKFRRTKRAEDRRDAIGVRGPERVAIDPGG